MATLIPSISTCASRMTSGERRVAQRLEDKLDDDYLLWYDVPMGPKNAHPDFCLMHSCRDILAELMVSKTSFTPGYIGFPQARH